MFTCLCVKIQHTILDFVLFLMYSILGSISAASVSNFSTIQSTSNVTWGFTQVKKNMFPYIFDFQKMPNISPIPTECTLQERNRMNVKSATKPLVGMTAWWSTNEYIQVPYRYFRNFLRIVLSQSLIYEDGRSRKAKIPTNEELDVLF